MAGPEVPTGAAARLPVRLPIDDVWSEEDFERAYRRHLHRKQLTSDMTLQAVEGEVVGICCMRLLLDGCWLPACLAFLSTVLSLGTICFISHYHKLWRRHREAFVFLCCAAHYSVAAFIGASGLNFLAHHGNSPFRSFIHFSYSNTAVWQLINALMCRMLFRRLILMQLPLALVALPWSGRLCRDALSHPGVEHVIARMFRNISNFLALAVNPAVLPAREPDPQAMCCAINTWTLVVGGVVIPLYIAYCSELRDRADFMRVACRSLRRGSPPLPGSNGSYSGVPPNPRASTPSSTAAAFPSSSGGSGVGEDVSKTPPPLAGWWRRRLQRSLHQLQPDPSLSGAAPSGSVAGAAAAAAREAGGVAGSRGGPGFCLQLAPSGRAG